MTYQELQQQIDKQLPTSNLPYAIRLQGTFPSLKVRSVPKQTPPYSPLNDVVSQQEIVFELQNVQGTLVGFRLPQYLKDVNVAGYHLHFITSDRKAGGHLLDGTFLNSVVDMQTLKDWQIMLPCCLPRRSLIVVTTGEGHDLFSGEVSSSATPHGVNPG